MKPLKSDQDKKESQRPWRFRISYTSIFSIILFLLVGICILPSCENDLEKIKIVTSIDQFPDASGKKYEILYSDSFRLRVRILAPEIERFARLENPVIKFPKGMTAYFYDDSVKIEAYFKAKDVIYYEKDNLWEAKNNVEGRNLANGNQLNTEHMFWDEKKHLIYSHTRSRIVNEDGTFYGENGFEAKQDLSWYRLKKSKGVVNLKDE
jgi:LPS export ABC transporter protein LptC